MNVDSTLAPIRDAFRAVTRAVAPASSDLDEDGWLRAEEIVDGALRDRPASVRRQLLLFVKALELLSRLRYGRSLDGLEPERLHSFLLAFERSPLLLARRGFWGIRTLAYMGYYGQTEVRAGVGYRADPRGWSIREGTRGPWMDRAGAGEPEQGILVGEASADRQGLIPSRDPEARRHGSGTGATDVGPRRSLDDDHA